MRWFAKTRACALVILFAGLAAVITFAQDSRSPNAEAAKLQPGVYYWSSQGWQPMEPLEWSANGVRKTGKSAVWSYRHRAARVQLKEASPLFCYRLAEFASGKPDAAVFEDLLVIARLDQKKDHREFENNAGPAAFAFQAGPSKEHTREVGVTEVSPEVFLIAPKEPLSPGEYVLGGSSIAISGYDFGIRSIK